MNGKPCDICTHEHHTQGQGSSPVECVHIRENDERRSRPCDIVKYRMTQGDVFYCFVVIKLAHAPRVFLAPLPITRLWEARKDLIQKFHEKK